MSVNYFALNNATVMNAFTTNNNWKPAKIKKYMAALVSLSLAFLRGEDRTAFLLTDSKKMMPSVEELTTRVLKLFEEKVC